MSEEEKTHLIDHDGRYGDLHCMTCLKICNFEEGNFCCDFTRDMPPPMRRSENAFLMVCLQRHAIDEMVRAMIAGKKIVDKKGHCVFCRTVKKHEEEKWCAGKSVKELYLHQIDKEERKIDKCLEKYLEIRIQNRQDALNLVATRVRRETQRIAVNYIMTDDDLLHILARQDRESRRSQRKEMDQIEVENDGIRRRMAAKLAKKREETIKKIDKETANVVVDNLRNLNLE